MADLPVPAVFLAVAGLTFAGFWAGRVFQRTRLPDAIPLLMLGLVLGPVNRWAAQRGFGLEPLAEVLDPVRLQEAAPFIAGLALVVLLFESGMQLDFGAFGRSLGTALLFTLPVYALTVLAVAAVGHGVLGMPLVVAVVLGIALVNVDQTVSSGVLARLRIDPRIRAVYFVEMALYDLISIPLFVSFLEFASGTAAAGDGAAAFLRGFASLLSVSLALGFACGALWIFALRRLKGHPHSYMLTFAVMLGTYGLSELLGGSGALSTLIFGLLLGNRAFLLKRFGHLRNVDDEHAKVQAFHDEIAFFIRTVFFLFLGASFTLGMSGRWEAASPLPGLSALDHTTALLVVGALLMLAGIVAARALWTWAVARRRPERRQLFPVFGRGLDTAVLVTVPFLATSYTQGQAYRDLFYPWQPVFLNLSLMVVILTVVASGLAAYAHERRQGPAPPAPPVAYVHRPAGPPERGPEVAVPLRGAAGAARPGPAGRRRGR